MNKNFLSLILSVLLVFSLCACGADNSKGENITDILPSEIMPTNDSTSGENGEPSDTTVTVPEESESSALAEKETEIELSESTTVLQNPTANFDKESMTVNNGKDQNGKFVPLETVKYEATDPNNSRGLSVKKISHSHGPASGGKPHHTVVAFQDTFDKYHALTLDRTSTEKVLYLTFDCGWEHNNLTSEVLDTLKEKGVPATFFCTLDHIQKQPALITRMIDEGHIVGNHSATHPSFAEIDRTKMASEIEKTENYLRENFGYCAKYFRFPAGEYSENALDLVSSLGYTSVFWSVAYNDWNVNEIKGKDYAVKTVFERLHPGAVILLHSVSQDNAQALPEIIDRAREQGYQFKALSDYKFPN